MKKLILGLALLGTLSASAINVVRTSDPRPAKMSVTKPELVDTMTAPFKNNASDAVITSPEGTEKLYSKEVAGTFRFMDDAFYYEEVFNTKLIWGEDNDVYFYNILSLAEYDTFVKGKVEGDKVVIDLPQTAAYDAEEGRYVELAIVQYHEYRDEFNRPAGEYIYCPDYDQITFELADNGVLRMVIPGDQYDFLDLPDYGLGYVYSDNKEWTGFVDFSQVLTPTQGAINVIPAGTVMNKYTFIYDSHGIIVEVGFNGDYMYIRGLNPNFPDGVIIASIEGNTAIIKQNQIMGIYSDTLMYLKLVKYNEDYNYETDDPYLEYFFAPPEAVFTLQLSDDRKTIRSGENEYELALNGSPSRLYTLAVYKEINLDLQTSYAGTPRNPAEPYWYDEFKTGGTGLFFFYVYDVSTDGSMLDPEQLYYSIYVDGQIMTFVQELNPSGGRPYYFYPQIYEPTTRIPYLFTNWQDIYLYADTPRRMVEIYDSSVKTVGVQSVYVYDGVTTVSDILSYDILTGKTSYIPASESGLGVVTADPVAKGVYNLQGMKILDSAQPSDINSLPKGIYIVDGKKVYVR